MKPVFQEIVDKGIGDCFSACLASLLELPIEAVPKFRRDNPGRDMMIAARQWAMETLGLSIVSLQMEDFDDPEFQGKDIRIIGAVEGTPVIAGGTSPNFEGVNHAVVGTIDGLGNFTLLHDPNPSGKGIVGRPKHIYLLVPLLPERSTHPKHYSRKKKIREPVR